MLSLLIFLMFLSYHNPIVYIIVSYDVYQDCIIVYRLKYHLFIPIMGSIRAYVAGLQHLFRRVHVRKCHAKFVGRSVKKNWKLIYNDLYNVFQYYIYIHIYIYMYIDN